jgi:long-chain acyl-CoA synthetase
MLVSENRPEWLIADLAIMAAGCVTVPTYTTNTDARSPAHPRQFGARAVIVSTQKLARTLMPAVLFSSECQHVIGSTTSAPASRPTSRNSITGPSWSRARPTSPRSSADGAGRRDDLACIIYTSGTGGAPRGVMQHHGMILHNVEGCIDVIADRFRLGRRGVPVLPAGQPRL